ncbi:GGDEF domain-containing protein [Mycolicibacterium sp. J2]|uniref:GGDEF domain-containing protein n=1 Tax=Mycolicibacterium sp. J2 TaxID=2993511 RepID=UPI00224A4C86|nr:GGDEF domain-containing protein [Mycolicibacterium sp. J2]MCX2714511.1 GGDEF domain-containing protein [Mycolicibacterium sp. J2]
MRSICTAGVADWLDQPDPFDAVTAFLHNRGLTHSARVMLAIVSASSILAPLAMVVPTYREVTLLFAVIIALIGCCLSCVMTWFWLTHWPTRRQSLITVSLCTACAVAWSVVQPSAALAALTCAAVPITSGYIAFFHSNRALLLNMVAGLAASGCAVYRLAHEVNIETAIAAVWLLGMLNTLTPITIRGTSKAMSVYASRSDTDALTGLLNRRGFLDTVERHLVSAPDDGPEYVVAIMVDLDDFKRINDTLGHAEGDRVLLHVADILREHAPPTSAICRAGGEEFLLAAMSWTADPCVLAAPLCEAITSRLGDVSASIGVAAAARRDVQSAPAPAEAVLELVSAADLAMYEAKRSGGNRVVVGTPR